MSIGDVLGARFIGSPSITRAIEEEGGIMRVSTPMHYGDCVRASGAYRLCARAEVLRSQHAVYFEDCVNEDTLLTFNLGTGMHWILQNDSLPRVLGDGFLGHWRCRQCGEMEVPDPLEETSLQLEDVWGKRDSNLCVGSRPRTCLSCRSSDRLGFEYVEVTMSPRGSELDPRASGHSDGILRLPGKQGAGVFEAKSISARGFEEARKVPKAEHILQVNLYMWFLNLDWAVILYWCKGLYGKKALAEHFVKRDEALIKGFSDTLEALQEGLKDPARDYPEKICARASCARANACPVKEFCFSEKY